MRRGFTMLEILGTLILLAAAAAIGGQLFYRSITAIRMERTALNQQSAKAALLEQLRRDTLDASEVAPLNGGVLLRTSAGEVAYSVAEGITSRIDAAGPVPYPLVPMERIDVEGAAIHVSFGMKERVSILAPFAIRKGATP